MCNNKGTNWDEDFFKSNSLDDNGLLLKAKKMPIGSISNGRKKVSEGKWVPVKSGDKSKKESKEFNLTTGISGGNHIIQKQGKGETQSYAIVGAKGEGMIRTTFSSPEKANEYAKKNNIKIVDEEKKKETEYDSKAQAFLDALRIHKNYKNLDNITVVGTPSGNWAVSHKGKGIGIVNGSLLDEKTIRKYGLEEH